MPRPRTFDEDQVIDAAMQLFWSRGYEATSLNDLTAALGIHPGSLYRTFGDKHQLFLRALGRYRDTQTRPAVASLDENGPVLDNIRAILAGVVRAATAEPRGCLVGNTAGECLPDDPDATLSLRSTLGMLEDGLAGALQRAAERGELRDGIDPAAAALQLVALIQGLQTVSKVDADPARLDAAVDAAIGGLARHDDR